jgi:pyruvate dehydrogenase E1 component beta subunit
MARLNMVKALNLALMQEMERDRDIVIIGEDVGVDGGVFRVTDDLQRTYGSQRVIDSPLAEAAIVGASVGMALYGLKPICEIQFSGFAFQCFHQIENHAATACAPRALPLRHRSSACPTGRGAPSAPLRSRSSSTRIPGLKMVIPPGRARRAPIVSAIRDPDPVVFFEAKALYHAAREDVPDEVETLPLGQARVVRKGRDLTLISYGAMLRVAREQQPRPSRRRRRGRRGRRSAQHLPLDRETLNLREQDGPRRGHSQSPRSFGPGRRSRPASSEQCFLSLEAPVRRVAAHDVPFVGFARERFNVPDVPRVVAAARETLAF